MFNMKVEVVELTGLGGEVKPIGSCAA